MQTSTTVVSRTMPAAQAWIAAQTQAENHTPHCPREDAARKEAMAAAEVQLLAAPPSIESALAMLQAAMHDMAQDGMDEDNSRAALYIQQAADTLAALMPAPDKDAP